MLARESMVFPAKTKCQGKVERRVVLNGYQASQMHWCEMCFDLNHVTLVASSLDGNPKTI